MNIDADKIEELYGQWYKNIDDTLEETNPKTRVSFYIHARDSDFLKLLEITYQNLSRKPVWTREDMEVIRNIQQLMREENLRLYREAWEKKLKHLNRIYKDSSKFWEGVKRLIGTPKEKLEYILHPNRQNEKVFEAEEKEAIYRSICANIFSIPPEDNTDFDQENEERVMAYLNANVDNIRPHQYADLSCLDRNSYLTTPFRTSDVIYIIKKFKNKAPGKSGINKMVLSNLPRNALDSFALITNLTYSMGYYPVILKNGLIVFTPKTGKDP